MTEVAHAERQRVRGLIHDVPDFPKQGILYRDLTPVFGDARALHWLCERMAAPYLKEPPDVVVAIEARGYILGAPIAMLLEASFVPLRKPGKLPRAVESISYALEYGEGHLQVHADALEGGSRVVVVDDLLATGGTAEAAGRLVTRMGARVVGYSFAVELAALGGRARLGVDQVGAEIVYE